MRAAVKSELGAEEPESDFVIDSYRTSVVYDQDFSPLSRTGFLRKRLKNSVVIAAIRDQSIVGTPNAGNVHADFGRLRWFARIAGRISLSRRTSPRRCGWM